MKEEMDARHLATEIRKDVLKMTYEKKAGFIGTSFSCADILAVLYGKIVNIDYTKQDDEDNDTVIMSKGHGASAWYAALANVGAFDKKRLDEEFNTSGYKMGVHPKRNSLPGIRTSSGSLGQGAGLGCGIALAHKIQKNAGRVYVIVGDGECNEGSVWESFMFGKRYKLDNLVVIIDRNRLQSYGHDEEVLNMGDMKNRLDSFGWNAIEVDGHNCDELQKAFEQAEQTKGKPTAIIANTIKGKGAKDFEDKVLWHYKWPEKEHYDRAIKELSENEK
jgi:transketolase